MSPVRDEVVRVPFNVIDETVAILDAEAAPWSIQLEARVSGSLDPDRLRSAVHAGLARHPLARARRVPASAFRHRHEWHIGSGLDLDPFRVLDCPDDASLAAARAELYSLTVPLAESPPLRVRLARHPDGDVVMLNVNHAVCDGFGVLGLLRSIARAYTGEDDPVAGDDVSTTRDLDAALRGAGAGARVRHLGALADKLRDLLGAPARLAGEEASDHPGYGVHHVALSPAQTAALVGADRGGATVNDVLLAALHWSIGVWNAVHGQRRRRIGVMVPVNLRGGHWHPETVANLSLPVRVVSAPGDHASPVALLEAVRVQTARIKRDGTAAALVALLQGPAELPVWLKRVLPVLLWLTGNRLVDTALLSNLGHVADPPSFGDDAGATSGLWFSAPARMPLGLTVGAATTAGRLHLVFRYRYPLFGPAAAARFAETYRRALGLFVDLPADEDAAAG